MLSWNDVLVGSVPYSPSKDAHPEPVPRPHLPSRPRALAATARRPHIILERNCRRAERSLRVLLLLLLMLLMLLLPVKLRILGGRVGSTTATESQPAVIG